VRVNYAGHILQLMTTPPGHVDFGYEVSRSLAACEGAVLLVDATRESRPRPWPTATRRWEHNLEIVAALNKIDLPARTSSAARRSSKGCSASRERGALDLGQTGQGVAELLDAIIQRIPAPTGDPTRRCGR